MGEEINKEYSCDVLVIGSGVSGYCAAIQAGRLGSEVILLEKDEVLGGNSGPNLGVGITGADRYNHYGTETGLVQETQEEGAWVMGFTQVYGTTPYNISRRYEAVIQQLLEEAGVTILKRHYARKPVLGEGGRIDAVVAEDMAAFRTVKITVRHVVVEGSGDGEIAVLADADYDIGSEAKNEFGERSAPEQRTNRVQGTSLVAIAIRTDREVVFIPPPGTPEFKPRLWHSRPSSFIHHHDNYFREGLPFRFLYVTEAGGDQDTVKEDGEIYETLLKQLWAEWDHIKNGPHREEARVWDLVWVSPKGGKRESRRLLGDVVMTQTDLEEGKLFPDDIAYGGHDLDDHRQAGDMANIFGHSIPPMYGIPYRACYSRNIPNLLLTGRLISATHLAHSSTRLMRTGGAIGQAVGIAADICRRNACSPRDVYERHIEELQRILLLEDGTLLKRPVDDPADIAPEATVTADSELTFNDQEPAPYEVERFLPLIAEAGVMLWDWPERPEGVEMFLKNPSDRDETLRLNWYRTTPERLWLTVDEFHDFFRKDLRDSSFEKLGSIEAVLPAGYEGWFRIDLPEGTPWKPRNAVNDGDRMIVSIEENDNVKWALAADEHLAAEMVAHSHFTPVWQASEKMPTFRFHPEPSLGDAANIINGFHRRFSRAPLNMWHSDPREPLPQELTLSWDSLKEFDEVCLTFDNLTKHRHDAPWECNQRVAPFLVKTYELEYEDSTGRHLLLREECNYRRFRRHRFDPVTAHSLRLKVVATHGNGEAARVYQIRVRRPE